MRPDIKIGVLVGVGVVVVLVVFFVNRGPEEPAPPGVPQGQDHSPLRPIQPVDQPAATPQPVVKPVIVDPQPSPAAGTSPSTGPEKPHRPMAQPAIKIDPEPEKAIVPAPVEPELVPQARQPRYYLVKTGDSLSEISETYYGHEKFWREIYQANRQLITHPDRLQVGWRLRIPYPEEIAGLGQGERNP